MNKTAVQIVWRHNFLQPGALSEVGEIIAHIQPQAVEIAAVQEFLQK